MFCSQIVMTVVTPVCKEQQSKIAEHLGQFQGHILNLVPGDYQYDSPSPLVGTLGIISFQLRCAKVMMCITENWLSATGFWVVQLKCLMKLNLNF